MLEGRTGIENNGPEEHHHLMMKQRNQKGGNWSIRRRFMFAVSALCAYVILYILHNNVDTGPADTAMTMAFTTLISITASYVFGAAWEDINRIKAEADTTTVAGKGEGDV